MFWSKLGKSNWNCASNLAFPVLSSPIVWPNMCENLHYESAYFKELHNEQEYYWPTIYRAAAAVVSTITSCMVLLGNWVSSAKWELTSVFILFLHVFWTASHTEYFFCHKWYHFLSVSLEFNLHNTCHKNNGEVWLWTGLIYLQQHNQDLRGMNSSSFFTRMHCTTNNSNKNTRWVRAQAAQM